MSLSNVLRFFFVSLTITSSRSSLCNPEQRDALSQFKNSFSISGPPSRYDILVCTNTSYLKTALWKEDQDCCSWEGVSCDNSSGVVVGLDLSCARLQGTIYSNSSLFSLRHLRSLSLAGNHFIGIIPHEISLLSKLVSLNLSSSGLEIQNPTMAMLAGNLTWLEELDLSSVNMYTVVPTSMMNFSSSLISLHLSDCSLEGRFPDNIFQLPHLQNLDLSSNSGLQGTLPESNWSSSLVFLSLEDCSFTGVVPLSIGSLPRLTSLELSGNNFTGSVNFRTFSLLKNLRFLGLSGLSVSGEDATDANHTFPKLEKLVIYAGTLKNFPCFLSSMPELRGLYLSWSIADKFPGRCADNVLSFPQLQALEMGFCKLTKFPSFLSHSKKLIHLYLGGNMIKEIPSWFWGIGTDTLEELYLNDNLLKGEVRLPWKKLARLHLHSNSFEGPLPIPPSPSIREFVASRNHFSGSISPSICQLTSLVSLGLSQNNLTGVIPQCIGNLTDLWELDLSNNSLTGPLPPSLDNCTSMQTLDVSYNFLGRWPADIFLRSTSLRFIDLSTNNFDGPLPFPSSATNYYSVSNNHFSGEISSLLCNATNLWILDLSSNGITGGLLPRCQKNITIGLEYLNLRVNKFQGLIPEIFPEGSSLKTLDLSRNQFEGPLPRSLSNCKGLEALDVGSNMIADSFPDWLGDLPLKVLSIRSNKFNGGVSVSEGTHSFSSIRVLDLSNNGFDGKIPVNLINEMLGMTLGDDLSGGYPYPSGSGAGYMVTGQASYRQEFYSVMINLKGVETEMVKINVQFATLDLSSNRLCGEIPRNVGLLKSLMGLNFSHNGFTGAIPPSIVNLTNLESLDLSSNNFVGGIPRELIKLTSLGALDLSWNNLTGPIPSGGHFNTFSNASFEGNPGLCGIPLTRSCDHVIMDSLPSAHDGDDESRGWLEWKFAGMGFGSGIVVGISLGYIALETARPLWLARIIIRLESGGSKRSKIKARKRNARS